METFVGKTPDMLRLVLDVLRPRKFEEFVEYVSTIHRKSDADT